MAFRKESGRLDWGNIGTWIVMLLIAVTPGVLSFIQHSQEAVTRSEVVALIDAVSRENAKVYLRQDVYNAKHDALDLYLKEFRLETLAALKGLGDKLDYHIAQGGKGR